MVWMNGPYLVDCECCDNEIPIEDTQVIYPEYHGHRVCNNCIETHNIVTSDDLALVRAYLEQSVKE